MPSLGNGNRQRSSEWESDERCGDVVVSPTQDDEPSLDEPHRSRMMRLAALTTSYGFTWPKQTLGRIGQIPPARRPLNADDFVYEHNRS